MDKPSVCTFIKSESVTPTIPDSNAHNHSHEQGGQEHAHEQMEHQGRLAETTINRTNWKERAFTVGIGGPVGSGKTALLLMLCRHLRERYSIAVVTNDIFTKEDGEFLIRNNALSADRIIAVETGSFSHDAVREDITMNLSALENLSKKFPRLDLLFVESGGDNLATNFSRELADFTIYVIDVAGGDKIPRKGGPGITQSDLLVINKTDLAVAVGADLELMERQANDIRHGKPVIMAQVKHDVNVDKVVEHILHNWQRASHSH